jgi:hypothetical protein
MGQVYLASGITLGMRLWREEPTRESEPVARRDYEVVGYVLEGRAELEIEEQKVLLKQGDSYVVPRGAAHDIAFWNRFRPSKPPRRQHRRMVATNEERRRKLIADRFISRE